MRTVAVTTTRAMTKAARAGVAGATRTRTTATTAATATVMAAMMTPNGNKHNIQILSQHQR